MKRLGPAQQPFKVSDGILSFCLYLAGVPFLTTRNLYTKETFRKLGLSGEIDLCEAATDCVARNLKGDLKYLFRQSPNLRGLLKIFSDQQERIKEDKGEARDVIRGLMESYSRQEIELEEAVMRICCLVLKLRGPFLNQWKELPPLIAIPRPGEERKFKTQVNVRSKTGSKFVPADGIEYPGFDIIPANASDELKKRMGLL